MTRDIFSYNLLLTPTSVTMLGVCFPLKVLRHVSRDVSPVLLGRLHCGNVQLWSLNMVLIWSVISKWSVVLAMQK